MKKHPYEYRETVFCCSRQLAFAINNLLDVAKEALFEAFIDPFGYWVLRTFYTINPNPPYEERENGGNK